MKKKHIGSNFDDFLKEENLYEQVQAVAMKRIAVKINSKNQIAIPQAMLEKLNVKAGDRLLVDVQDGIMVLIPRPKSYTNRLQGLHSEIWETIDVEKYINGERNAWTKPAGIY